MRAIVKPWNRECFVSEIGFFYSGTPYVYGHDPYTGCAYLYFGSDLELINEDEWDAEIYALLLIESGVIYE